LLDKGRDAEVRGWYDELARRHAPAFAVTPRDDGAQGPPFVFDQVYGPCAALWRIRRQGPTTEIYALPVESQSAEGPPGSQSSS